MKFISKPLEAVLENIQSSYAGQEVGRSLTKNHPSTNPEMKLSNPKIHQPFNADKFGSHALRNAPPDLSDKTHQGATVLVLVILLKPLCLIPVRWPRLEYGFIRKPVGPLRQLRQSDPAIHPAAIALVQVPDLVIRLRNVLEKQADVVPRVLVLGPAAPGSRHAIGTYRLCPVSGTRRPSGSPGTRSGAPRHPAVGAPRT